MITPFEVAIDPLLIILEADALPVRDVQMIGSGGPGTINLGPSFHPRVMVAAQINTSHVGASVREATVTVLALGAVMPVAVMIIL